MIEAEGKERKRAAGGDRKSEEYRLSSIDDKRSADYTHHGTSVAIAAKSVGISPTSVTSMKRIKGEAPELFEKVSAGEIPIHQATVALGYEGTGKKKLRRYIAVDTSDMLTVLALGSSVLSLLISGVLIARQISTARQANALPILIELTQEFQSEEFQRAERYARRILPKEHLPNLGISELPEEARLAVTRVVSLYITLGAYVNFKIADEAIVVMLYGSAADRTWTTLEPYIEREREIRDDPIIRGYPDGFATFFEDLVWRIRRNQPHAKAYNVRRHRLTDQDDGPGKITVSLTSFASFFRRLSSHLRALICSLCL
jgi:hypothetical protein